MKAYDILMVGAAIYGITTALELKARGHHVKESQNAGCLNFAGAMFLGMT
jgi:glycine/D-amino acid oxidase-like deaminating enzyme